MSKWKYWPYSFSKIKMYKTCPRKFYYNYIRKIEVPPPTKFYLEKGGFGHKILENKINNNLKDYKIDLKNYEEFTYDDAKCVLKNLLTFCNTDEVSRILTTENRKFTEFFFNLDSNISPCDKKKKLLSGVIDYLEFDKNKIIIYDWKFGGKNKQMIQKFPSDPLQLQLYGIWALEKYPEYNEVYSGFYYVEHDYCQEEYLFRENKEEVKRNIRRQLLEIEEDTTFEKNESKLCDYCEFKDICVNEN